MGSFKKFQSKPTSQSVISLEHRKKLDPTGNLHFVSDFPRRKFPKCWNPQGMWVFKTVVRAIEFIIEEVSNFWFGPTKWTWRTSNLEPWVYKSLHFVWIEFRVCFCLILSRKDPAVSKITCHSDLRRYQPNSIENPVFWAKSSVRSDSVTLTRGGGGSFWKPDWQ